MGAKLVLFAVMVLLGGFGALLSCALVGPERHAAPGAQMSVVYHSGHDRGVRTTESRTQGVYGVGVDLGEWDGLGKAVQRLVQLIIPASLPHAGGECSVDPTDIAAGIPACP
jgi:hypothetical protein